MSASQHPPDVFILVRPPPSKNNHHLNVQIQLITGLSTTSSSVAKVSSRLSGDYSRSSESGTSTPASFDAVASASVGGGGMVRSPSVRSGRSARSNRSGSSSMGSQVGGSSRRVTPLYNLTFHAVLSTVVTDAGTDAKVAKFLKRGVEVHNLAILDPVELSPTNQSPPLVSSQSRSSDVSSPVTTTPQPAAQETSFLSKFKRLSFKSNMNNLLPPSVNSKLLSKSESSNSITNSAGLNVLPLFRTPSNPDAPPNPSESGSIHSSTPTATNTGAKYGYTWTVRRWLRNDLDNKTGATAAEEIRFEWKKSSKRPKPSSKLMIPRAGQRGGEGGKSDTHLPVSRSPSSKSQMKVRRSLDIQSTRPNMTRRLSPVPSPPLPAGEDQITDPNNLNGRKPDKPKSINFMDVQTPDSERSISPAWDSNSLSDDDSGEESDPEDSERPWTCELVYGPKKSERRLLLATLTPAPHHPKLVAHLAVPFSLRPIPLGRYDPACGVSNEGLSVEEMKDVVSVTVLWLCVREGLGGLGKKRKGDAGWKRLATTGQRV